MCITAGGFSFKKQSDAKKVSENGYHVAQLCPSGGCNDGGEIIMKVFFAEAIATFLFISFVLMIKKHNGAVDCDPVNSLANGLILFLSMTMVSGISGGCINPVIGLL